jgi:nucleoside 2-deoxyribosyltransferase
MKLYLAAPLFSESEINYNDYLHRRITELGHEVYAPQKNMAINDKSQSADSIAIFQGDTEQLEWADALIAVLDGPVIDPGVAAEIGYMVAKGKRIYGLLTDSRENVKTVNAGKIKLLTMETAESQFPYLNLYVVGAIKSYGNIFTSTDELIEALRH